MSEGRGNSCCRYVFTLLLVVCPVGCSRPGGFYVVPEHKDLGVINDDKRIAVADFEIVNGLDQPVDVQHIYPSCQCTTVKLTKNPIPPGESSILRATADLSKQAGKQEVSVMFVTDSPDFPSKRISFEVMVPATGTRQRRISMGSFYPGDKVNFELPVSSFARGSVKPVEGSRDSDNVDTAMHLDDSRGVTTLVVNSTAPHAVGPFSRKFRFRESIPGEPSLGQGIIELELTGKVVARWVVKPEIYCGFISLNKDGGIISQTIERNAASVEQKKNVSTVSAKFSEDWLSLSSQSVSSDRIELVFKIHEDKLIHLGAVQTAMDLTIEYTDGNVESYSPKLFAYIDH